MKVASLAAFSRFPLVISLVLSVASLASAQSVATTPVGYVSVSCSASSDTIVSVPLSPSPAFIGSIQSSNTTVPNSSATFTVSGSTGWNNNQFVYSGTGSSKYFALIGPKLVSIPGTVSLTSGTNLVTGSGTQFLTGTTPVAVGDGLLVTTVTGTNGYYFVKSVTSDTSLTVAIPALFDAAGATAQVSKSAKEGSYYTITANDSSTLTVNLNGDDISNVQTGTTISVVPYWTLNTVFPATDAGTSFIASPSAFSVQTQILIPAYSGTGINLAAPIKYYYLSSVTSGTGWRQLTKPLTEDHGDDILLPGGYFTVRNGASATTLTTMGNVSTQFQAVPLATGSNGVGQDNYVSYLRPLPVTLNSSGLVESGFVTSPSSFSQKDKILVYDSTQVGINKTALTYYYLLGASGTGWRLSTNASTDAGNISIPFGSGVVIRKAVTVNGATQFSKNYPIYPF